MNSLKERIALFLFRLGITADVLTLLGLGAAFACGALSYKGIFFWAGGMLLLSGLLDLLDGAVARASGRVSVFGGIMDSSLDRYGDAFAYGGLALFFARLGDAFFTGVALSALAGSFAVSYVRARAECAIPSCRVGYWERGERLVYLALGLLTGNVGMALLVLGTMTHFTVLYRLAYAKNPERYAPANAGAPRWACFFTDTRRSTPFYVAKCAFWLALLLVRIPS